MNEFIKKILEYAEQILKAEDNMNIVLAMDDIEKLYLHHKKLLKHSLGIEILEEFGLFLEKEGYMDTDWRTEEPYAIDKFIERKRR